MTTTSTPTLAERIRNIDVRHPETLDIFELRAAIEKAVKDLDLPEIDLDRLDVFGLRDLISKLDLPEFEMPEFEMPEFDAEAFDRFDLLGVRKAIVDADRVEFTRPSSPGDVVSQMEDVRASFESIVKSVYDNATDLAPVTRKELADLEQRVIKAERAAKKSTAKKSTAKKATAKKATAKKATASTSQAETAAAQTS